MATEEIVKTSYKKASYFKFQEILKNLYPYLTLEELKQELYESYKDYERLIERNN